MGDQSLHLSYPIHPDRSLGVTLMFRVGGLSKKKMSLCNLLDGRPSLLKVNIPVTGTLLSIIR